MNPPIVTVFARAPELGRVKTRLARTLGDLRALELYRWLGAAILHGLVSGARDLALRVAYTPDDGEAGVRAWVGDAIELVPQGDGDLGARMSRAVRSGLAAGHRGVILVGTDCLAVTPERVRDAARALATHDAVMGAARDGGYYLLGLAREAPVFDAMTWSVETVAETTRQRLRTAGFSLHELPVEVDVDERDDLPSLAHAMDAPGAPSWLRDVLRGA